MKRLCRREIFAKRDIQVTPKNSVAEAVAHFLGTPARTGGDSLIDGIRIMQDQEPTFSVANKSLLEALQNAPDPQVRVSIFNELQKKSLE